MGKHEGKRQGRLIDAFALGQFAECVGQGSRHVFSSISSSSSIALQAAATVGATEVGIRAAGLTGADRRFTGSHEIASFNPSRMPRVSWFDDTAPT
ncbi:MAG: hypothetical protein AAGE43_09920, partial [Pseudomonadota bacterium]